MGYEVRLMFLFEKKELVDGLEQAEVVGGETITGKCKQKSRVRRNK